MTGLETIPSENNEHNFLFVDGVAPDNWHRAIGSEDGVEIDMESLDGTELVPCCERISAVRQLLMRCITQGGLSAEDARDVEENILKHGGMWMYSDRYLAEVLWQLGFQLQLGRPATRYKAPHYKEKETVQTLDVRKRSF